MYYVHADWNDDGEELFSSPSYKDCLRFAERYLLSGKLDPKTGFYSLDVVHFEPDYCDDHDCSCHRYRGKSLWHFETSLELVA